MTGSGVVLRLSLWFLFLLAFLAPPLWGWLFYSIPNEHNRSNRPQIESENKDKNDIARHQSAITPPSEYRTRLRAALRAGLLWLDKNIAIVTLAMTFLLLLANIYLAGATRSSVNLQRQQLEGTLGAVLTFAIEVDAPPGGGGYNTPTAMIKISLINKPNRADANFRGAELTFQMHSWPSDAPAGTPLPWKMNDVIVTSDQQKEIPFEVPDLVSHFEELRQVREILFVEGTYTYNNGFKDRTESVCYRIIANIGSDRTFSGLRSFTCDQARRYLYELRFYQEQKQKQK
jgi:hypothetical protein